MGLDWDIIWDIQVSAAEASSPAGEARAFSTGNHTCWSFSCLACFGTRKRLIVAELPNAQGSSPLPQAGGQPTPEREEQDLGV